MKKYIFSFFIILMLTSCNLLSYFSSEEKETSEPEYKSQIAWTVDTNTYGLSDCRDMVRYGQYLYVIDGKQFSGNYYFNLIKIEIETGEIIWKTETIYTIVTCNVVKCGTKLYLAGEYDHYLYSFDDETGKLLATVTFSDDENINEIISPDGLRNIVAYKDRYLFWSNYRNEDAKIIKFDTEKIDFSIEAESLQIINAEAFGNTGNEEDFIYSCILLENGMIYYITSTAPRDNTFVKVGAVDCETGELKWSYVIQGCYATGGGYTMYYLDGKPLLAQVFVLKQRLG